MNQEKFSPLVRLYKYRPTVRNTPVENFLTESLAICFSHNPNIATTFIREIAGIGTATNAIIETQVKAEDKKSIFDLTLTDKKTYCVFIECKLSSRIGKNKLSDTDQIDKYVACIKEYNIENKKLLLIEYGASSPKNVTDMPFSTVRWNDIKTFIESQTGEDIIGEFIRVSLLDLLIHLKVDRKLIGGRLSWRCDLCGLETIGQAIYSHQRKHEKEEKYKKVINDINEEIRSTFDSKVSPYKEKFNLLSNQVKSFGKIDKNNFTKRQEITNLLIQYLPKEAWLYFMDKVKNTFSNKAFLDYRKELESELNKEHLEIIVEPNYVMATFENILRHASDKQ